MYRFFLYYCSILDGRTHQIEGSEGTVEQRESSEFCGDNRNEWTVAIRNTPTADKSAAVISGEQVRSDIFFRKGDRNVTMKLSRAMQSKMFLLGLYLVLGIVRPMGQGACGGGGLTLVPVLVARGILSARNMSDPACTRIHNTFNRAYVLLCCA